MEPMTTAGAERLREELAKLKKEERPKIIQAIASARELGDLKENAEYHTAKDRQGMIEGRITIIENTLRSARIIDIKTIPNTNRAVFGCTVTLKDLAKKKNIKYQIVGNDEADAPEQKISYSSPLAKAIIGKVKGEKIKLDLADGELNYEIVKIEHI